jgi:hypothetical protein
VSCLGVSNDGISLCTGSWDSLVSHGSLWCLPRALTCPLSLETLLTIPPSSSKSGRGKKAAQMPKNLTMSMVPVGTQKAFTCSSCPSTHPSKRQCVPTPPTSLARPKPPLYYVNKASLDHLHLLVFQVERLYMGERENLVQYEDGCQSFGFGSTNFEQHLLLIFTHTTTSPI